MLSNLLTFALVLVGLFLIIVVLLQRGRGGGLVGAMGGMGGASAFGAKADIQLIKFTVYTALVWVALNCAAIFANRNNTLYNPEGVKRGTEVREAGGDDAKNTDPLGGPLDGSGKKDKEGPSDEGGKSGSDSKGKAENEGRDSSTGAAGPPKTGGTTKSRSGGKADSASKEESPKSGTGTDKRDSSEAP